MLKDIASAPRTASDLASKILSQKTTGQIVSRLGRGVVDAYLKHRKTAFQFDRPVLGTFLGAELGFQATIDFEGETGFGQFDCLAGHSVSVDRWRHGVRSGYSESGMADKAVLRTVKSMNDSFDLQRFVDAQILSSEYVSCGP